MAITSIGFDGSISEGAWAKLAPTLGKTPHVLGTNDLKVTTVTGVDRTVAIAVGGHSAFGVRADSDAPVNVQLATLATGTRWDTIAVRRDWTGVGGVTSIVGLTGGTSRVVAPTGNTPTTLNNIPGTVADTPIALVQITAGQQVPTAVVDLRVNALEQALTVDGANTWGLPVADTDWTALSFGGVYPGYSGRAPRIRTYKGRVYLEGVIERSNGADFAAGATVSLANIIPSGRRPDRVLTFFASRVASLGSNSARLIIYPDGSIQFVSLADSATICFDGTDWFPAA